LTFEQTTPEVSGERRTARGATIVDTVMGALQTRPMAERVVAILLEGGFAAKDVSVLGCDAARSSQPPDGLAADASLLLSGGVAAAAGGFGALALGLGVGVLPVPDVGPVLVVGSLSAELFAAVNSGVPGGLAGFFVDHGVPAPLAATYAEDIRAGGYVVVVHTDGGADGERAEGILEAQGAGALLRQRDAVEGLGARS
jgi:hypothetical protein